jgi:hypothetical protein
VSPPQPSPARAEIEPYRAILAHAELELELAGRGEVEALSALSNRWDELTRGLPERPPAAAASLLQRASLIHERTRIELLRLREDMLREISHTSRAKRTAEGYAGQLHARPRLDRRA